MKWLRKVTKALCEPAGDGQFGEDYRAMQQYAGEHMSAWDDRGIPGPQQWPTEQPGVGFANDHVRAADPTWKGPM